MGEPSCAASTIRSAAALWCPKRNCSACRRADLFDQLFGAVRIDGLRRLARQPQDDSAVGAVPYAGEGERAMQAGLEPGDRYAMRPRPVVARHLVEKAGGSRHRPHRVRTRRAYANLEEIEDREEHCRQPDA